MSRRVPAEIIDIVLSHYPETQAVYVFGSYGTAGEWPDSDIDVAVLLPPAQARKAGNLMYSRCRFDMARALGREVDLVNARLVTTVFQTQIISGDQVYVSDRYAAAEFEMLVLSFCQRLNEERRGILADFRRTWRAFEL